MLIGEVAALAGMPTATVRYYERRGLIAEPSRTPAGYRQYGPDTGRRLRFIKHAQELGFALEEIQQMLALTMADPASCARVQVVTREKVRTVSVRLKELHRLERVLRDLVHGCDHRGPSEPCPILSVLSENDIVEPRDSRGRLRSHV